MAQGTVVGFSLQNKRRCSWQPQFVQSLLYPIANDSSNHISRKSIRFSDPRPLVLARSQKQCISMAPNSSAIQGNPSGFRERMRRVIHKPAHTKIGTREESKAKEGQVDTARQTNTVGDQTGTLQPSTPLVPPLQSRLESQGSASNDKDLALLGPMPRKQNDDQRALSPVPAGSKRLSSTATDTTLTTEQRQELMLPGLSKSEALWNQAFAAVRRKEPDTIQEYEETLCPGTGTSSPAERMGSIVRQKFHDHDLKALSISLLGKSLKIRQLGESIITFISESKDFITNVASAEPHVALAWSGVSFLLPLLLNPKEQNDAMMQGLEKVSTILPLCRIRENLYLNEQPADSASVNTNFENGVIELYAHILEYQASLLCYLSKSPIRRGGRNLLKSDDWKGWLDQIEKSFKTCCSYTELFDIDAARRAWKEQYSQVSQQTRLQELILEAITTTRNERRIERNEKQYEKLIQSLSSNYEEQKDFNPKRVLGTCKWFLESEKFRDWRDATDSRILWVSADPGCGKSVLSRCLIDEHQVSNTTMGSTTTYFFFKDGLEGHQKPENALKAIVHQLLTENLNANLAAHVLPRFRAHDKKLGDMFSELWKTVVEISKDPEAGEIVCILDALDECEKNAREKLLSSLIDFYSSVQTRKDSTVRLKFLITSRPYYEIESKFSRLKESVNYVRFDGEAESDKIAQEINLFIDSKVPEAANFFPPEVQLKLTEHLKHMEHRTYLWLYLILDEIESKAYIHYTEPKILEFIENLPVSVQKAYETILDRSIAPETARVLLHIILAAQRALTVAELNVAFGVVEQPNCESYGKLDRPSNDIFKSSLRQICGLFVQVYDDKVYLLHQTARDFLIGTDPETERWEHSFDPEKSEIRIAQACVSLLCFCDFKDPPNSRGPVQFLFWVDKHAFLKYAASYWITHCVLAQDKIEDRILLLMMRLCNTASNRFISLGQIYGSLRLKFPSGDSDLIFASAVGLHMVAQILLDRGADVNAKDLDDCTALQISSEMGHETVVQLLLDKGADVNAQGGRYGTALQAASFRDNKTVVQLLLEKGADVNAQGGRYGTALQAASSRGHETVVQLLLDKGADINARGGAYGTALQAASIKGYETVVQLLLDKEADVNARGGRYDTALQAASIKGHEAVVQLLLNKGADVNARGGAYGTALLAASSWGYKTVVQLLLSKGADVSARSKAHKNTAVQLASYEGHWDVVKLLLKEGAKIHTRGEKIK